MVIDFIDFVPHNRLWTEYILPQNGVKSKLMFEKIKKQKGEGACERVRRGTIPLMSKDASLHVHFMKILFY
jgi:hypothetical protein